MTPVLALRGVAKVYGIRAAQVRAPTGVDLSVIEGKMVAVMGPSGSGKSTGESQRVGIARALVGERSLLADEPTGALDSHSGETVMRLLKAACRRGAAAVLVTHDAQQASWADRVVFVRDGAIVDQTASPAGPSRC